MSVPNTALIATTIAETISVSLIAATASGLETSRQNWLQPPVPDLASSAATGSSTSTDR